MADHLLEKVEENLFGDFAPPVRSLMDIDFYKLTMGQLIHQKYPNVEVIFELIVRDKSVPLVEIISERELRQSLDHAMGLRYRLTDLYYLRGMNLYQDYMFKESYLEFLKNFRLPPYELEMKNGALKLTFKSSWAYASMWETIALAVISELYYRGLLRKLSSNELNMVYTRAKDKLMRKLEVLVAKKSVRFADFGLRRRHSFLWQKYVVGVSKEVMGDRFTGTSNTWLAFHYDLAPIGTNAHELPMVLTALASTDEAKRYAQYQVLYDWEEIYGQGLRIFLPDTYGTTQFLSGAPEFVKNWKGYRQDSGDPITDAELVRAWYESKGVDSRSKLTIFSDGLDTPEILHLSDHFESKVMTAFGCGSLLTNDFRNCLPGNDLLRPFSMVCKVTHANGHHCIKLSNNLNKAVGILTEIERYKQIFGQKGLGSHKVVV